MVNKLDYIKKTNFIYAEPTEQDKLHCFEDITKMRRLLLVWWLGE
jgi:hypothetical protein